MQNMSSLNFGDCNQYHLAKLMFCKIAKLYTFCSTFFPVPVNYEKEVTLISVSSNLFYLD